MEYKNPNIPEGINYSTEHPLKRFLINAVLLLTVVLVSIFLLGLLAEFLARFIPFSAEVAIAEKFKESFIDQQTQTDQQQQIANYLTELGEKLARQHHLPEGMSITIHYSDDDIVNAFATLGGNIVMYRGLIEKLPNENAIAMVLSHEIAHIKHRDPITSLSRGLVITIGLSTLLGMEDSGLLNDVIYTTGNLSALSFSRDQERAADNAALETLQALYGHVEGADDLFEVFEDEAKKLGLDNTPAFLSTHPITAERIINVHNFAESSAPHSVVHTVIPKPDFLP